MKLESSMIGASFVYDTRILTSPDFPYAPENLGFMGIPGIEVTKNGRFYSVFYAGADGEGSGNFLLVHVSDDGEHFRPFCAVVPSAPGVRCFDAVPWIDPDGRLRLYWAQSYGLIDGRTGTWCAVMDDPDGDMPRFGAPRRVGNGIMMNKPHVTKGGAWLHPLAIWPGSVGPHDLPDERYCNVYRTTDGGESFARIGCADAPRRGIDEHMLYERADGTLVMLIRVGGGIGIAECSSTDGGVSWTYGTNANLGGPDSRFSVRRLQSGRLLLVNHKNFSGRNNLTAMLSDDDGRTWSSGLLLDARSGVSYPDVCQTPDGRIHIIYDYNRYTDREILLASITEADIDAGAIHAGSALCRVIAKAKDPRRLTDGAANGERHCILKLADGSLLRIAPDCCFAGFGEGLGVSIGTPNGAVWRGYLQLDGRAGCRNPRVAEVGGRFEAIWERGGEVCRASFTVRDILDCRISVTN